MPMLSLDDKASGDYVFGLPKESVTDHLDNLQKGIAFGSIVPQKLAITVEGSVDDFEMVTTTFTYARKK